jgi:hypothetical protein
MSFKSREVKIILTNDSIKPKTTRKYKRSQRCTRKLLTNWNRRYIYLKEVASRRKKKLHNWSMKSKDYMNPYKSKCKNNLKMHRKSKNSHKCKVNYSNKTNLSKKNSQKLLKLSNLCNNQWRLLSFNFIVHLQNWKKHQISIQNLFLWLFPRSNSNFILLVYYVNIFVQWSICKSNKQPSFSPKSKNTLSNSLNKPFSKRA